MKKKKHFLSMILGLALSLTILFPYEILALVLKITLLLMKRTILLSI